MLLLCIVLLDLSSASPTTCVVFATHSNTLLDLHKRSHGGPRGTFTEQEGEVRNSERGKKKVTWNSGRDEHGGARGEGK